MHTRCNKSVNQYVVNIVTLTYGTRCSCVCMHVYVSTFSKSGAIAYRLSFCSNVPSFRRIFPRFDRSSRNISPSLERTFPSNRNITFEPRLEHNSIVFDALAAHLCRITVRENTITVWSKLALLHDYVELDCGLDYTGGASPTR